MTSPDDAPAPIRVPFRLFAGLFALVAGVACIASLVPQFDVAGARQRTWLAICTVVFGFGARYFGYFCVTGLPPPRPPRNAWRLAFDVLFGVAATFVVVAFLYDLFGLENPTTVMVWLVTLVLVFARGVRWYWERGAASVRRREPQR
jgi:hypothetical protein